jgi:hypothetical protein
MSAGVDIIKVPKQFDIKSLIEDIQAEQISDHGEASSFESIDAIIKEVFENHVTEHSYRDGERCTAVRTLLYELRKTNNVIHSEGIDGWTDIIINASKIEGV